MKSPDKEAMLSLNTHTHTPTHTLPIRTNVNIGLNDMTDQMGLYAVCVELSHLISHLNSLVFPTKCGLEKYGLFKAILWSYSSAWFVRM